MDSEAPAVFGFIHRNLKRKRAALQSGPPQPLHIQSCAGNESKSRSNGHALFISLPSEIRQNILFHSVDDDDLQKRSNSDLLFLAIAWSEVHPAIRDDMPTVLGDWMRRRATLSRYASVSTNLVEQRITDQRRLLVLELGRRERSPKRVRQLGQNIDENEDPVESKRMEAFVDGLAPYVGKPKPLYWVKLSALARQRRGIRFIRVTVPNKRIA